MTEQTQAPADTKKKAEPEVETVTMNDGRKVDFVGKRKMLKESYVGEDGTIAVKFDFRNGESRTYPLHSLLLTRFAAHGAEQKYGDETAGLTDVDDMVLATDKLHSRLFPADESDPKWTVERESSGLAGTSILARALVIVKNTTMEKVKAFLENKTQAQKIALRNNPVVKAEIEKLEAEKANKGPKVDTEALLGELEA